MSAHTQRFMSMFPQARVRLEYLHPHKVVEAVLNDEADLGILSYPPTNRSLAVLPWRSETMVFVCYPAHRLARRRLVAAADLHEENFVAFDSSLHIRKAIDRCLRHYQAHPRIMMEFDNIETIKQAISVGAGVSILPQPTILKEVGNRTLAAIPLAMPEMVRPLGIGGFFMLMQGFWLEGRRNSLSGKGYGGAVRLHLPLESALPRCFACTIMQEDR